MFEVDIKMDPPEQILDGLGMGKGGKAQWFFSNEIMRLSDPYVPFRSGPLKNSARVSSDFEAIIYDTPYARYHWFGKLMVDPITGKGAFYDPLSGRFWSRPNTAKVLTDRDLKYHGGPLRGPRWVERCWLDNRQQIISATEQFIWRGCK